LRDRALRTPGIRQRISRAIAAERNAATDPTELEDRFLITSAVMKAANRKRSAGLLMYRRRAGIVEVFLAHPGGPFWAKKDAWTIPKGEYDDGEEPLDAARREFQEETGFTARGPFLPLGEIRQASGKLVIAWAFEGDCDPDTLRSN